VTYDQWEADVPDAIRADTLWRVKAYRQGLFLADLAWRDVTKLVRDRRTRGIADQLFRAAGNISSNVGEGYSRGTGRDRARFYEYALGSAREARDWYYKARHALGDRVVAHRVEICSEIIRLTLSMTARERRSNRRPDPRA
jgi:four helix bundle protein